MIFGSCFEGLWQLGLLAEASDNLVREWWGPGLPLGAGMGSAVASLALAIVRKFMVTELQWFTLYPEESGITLTSTLLCLCTCMLYSPAPAWVCMDHDVANPLLHYVFM